MSHPKVVNKFIPWSKAMVAGATVDKPDYGKGARKSLKKRKRKQRKRRKKMTNGSKD